jgi:hypothetical protein
MSFSQTEENRVRAIESKLNEIQVAISNLADKQLLRQTLLLLQRQVNDVRALIDQIEETGIGPALSAHKINETAHTEQLDDRYYRETEHIAASNGVSDASKPVVLDSSGLLDPSMIDFGDIDHDSLQNLDNDTHLQYHTDTRGDDRYFRENEHIASSSGTGDAGKPIILDASGLLDPSLVSLSFERHDTLSGLDNDDHTQYHTDGRADTWFTAKDLVDLGAKSHTDLTDIGTNTHSQVDSHIADNTIHFTEGSIDHGSVSGLEGDDHTQYLLVDGSRNMTGSLSWTGDALLTISGIAIQDAVVTGLVDGRDISADGVILDDHVATSTAHNVSGDIVGTTDVQVLTGKTLTSPTIANFINATHTHQSLSDGGILDHGSSVSGLDDDDHTQYVLVDGTRSMTGNLIVSGIEIQDAYVTGTVDGRDVSVDGTTLDTHVASGIAHGVISQVVGVDDTQTLTNKTLTSPVVDESLNITTSGQSVVLRVPSSNELEILDGNLNDNANFTISGITARNLISLTQELVLTDTDLVIRDTDTVPTGDTNFGIVWKDRASVYSPANGRVAVTNSARDGLTYFYLGPDDSNGFRFQIAAGDGLYLTTGDGSTAKMYIPTIRASTALESPLVQVDDGGILRLSGSGSTSADTMFRHSGSNFQTVISLGSESGRNFIFGGSGYVLRNFDHSSNDNPTIYIHSQTDPNTDNTQWMSISHNTLSGVINTGTGPLSVETELYVNGRNITDELDAAVTNHDELTGLLDDDHTQYVLADGTRDITGNITISGIIKLDGTTSSFPALKRNSDAIDVRLADDSGFADLNADTVFVGDTTGSDWMSLTHDTLSGVIATGQGPVDIQTDLHLKGDLVAEGILKPEQAIYRGGDTPFEIPLLSGDAATYNGNIIMRNAYNIKWTSTDQASTRGYITCNSSNEFSIYAGTGPAPILVIESNRTTNINYGLAVQSIAALPRPAITIDQDDEDEAFVNYEGASEAGTTKNITTYTSGNSIQGFVRVEINGVDYWMPYYDAPTS